MMRFYGIYPLVNVYSYGTLPFFHWKAMAVFHSYVSLPEGNLPQRPEFHYPSGGVVQFVYRFNSLCLWNIRMVAKSESPVDR